MKDISLREYLAGQAMIGLLNDTTISNKFVLEKLGLPKDTEYNSNVHYPMFIAKLAVRYADYLAQELNLPVGSEKERKTVISPKKKYRPWTVDEVPQTAQYMKRVYEGDVEKPILLAKEVASKLQYMFESYLYRTDLTKSEWFICGVEITEGENQ